MKFTRQLRKVADGVSRCMSNKGIAHELGITEGTVKVYLARIYRDFGWPNEGNSRVRLAVYMISQQYE